MAGTTPVRRPWTAVGTQPAARQLVALLGALLLLMARPGRRQLAEPLG